MYIFFSMILINAFLKKIWEKKTIDMINKVKRHIFCDYAIYLTPSTKLLTEG
jgi:hypothetical protein